PPRSSQENPVQQIQLEVEHRHCLAFDQQRLDVLEQADTIAALVQVLRYTGKILGRKAAIYVFGHAFFKVLAFHDPPITPAFLSGNAVWPGAGPAQYARG